VKASVVIAVLVALARVAAAQSRPEVHGFASEGGFISTSNDYLGESSRGSLELFEAGINVTTQIDDRLRFGLQLFARQVGDLGSARPRVDWAFADYRWRPWLGLRAGIVKMPFGLYNEFLDIDSAHLPILMPQSVYQTRNRDILLSLTGFLVYGAYPLGAAGELDYQAWLGTWRITDDELPVSGASLDEVDTKYVTGAQLFWLPPVEGLRVGGTVLRTSIDFYMTLGPELIQQFVDAGVVPPDYDGKLRLSTRPVTLGIGSAEYTYEDWLFAAEYSRWLTRTVAEPMIIPTSRADAERFYGMVNRRLSERLAVGAYYSVYHRDADDRRGRSPRYAERYQAWQRDLAATVQLDATYNWIWKLEAHFIDGTADLSSRDNPDPDRYWGLFLVKTTVSF